MNMKMRNRAPLLFWALILCTIMGLALGSLLSLTTPTLAQEEITVLSRAHGQAFAESITFRLTVESSSEINEIILFYKIVREAAINRAYPEFEPGRRVEAEWTWELKPGDIPLGSEIRYYWKVKDAAGGELKTEPIVLTYEDNRFDWQSISEGEITLHWYDEEQAFAQYLLDVALEALALLKQDVGVELEEPVKIFVYQTKTEMSQAIPSRSERFDEMIITLGMVVADDTMLLLGTAPGVEETIAHELSHVVVGLATKNPLGDIPRWLDEGLAMYTEGELPPGNAAALERAIHLNELISVRSLSAYTGQAEQVDLFYGEVYSLIDFMLKEYGKEKMAKLLAVFKEGAHQEDALQEVYGFGLDELDAQWRAYIGAPPRRGAATAEEEGRATSAPEKSKPSRRELCGCSTALPAVVLMALFFLFRPRSVSP
ncbi:MAG: peptidase MA family metallohydrolase [Anaerolineae bacterium]